MSTELRAHHDPRPFVFKARPIPPYQLRFLAFLAAATEEELLRAGTVIARRGRPDLTYNLLTYFRSQL